MSTQAADPLAGDVAQSRLTQVFKFLKALNELRNPVPRDLSAYSQILRLDTWPLHPNIIVQRGDREDKEDDADTDSEMEPIIRIQRARLEKTELGHCRVRKSQTTRLFTDSADVRSPRLIVGR
jgi:hypothetical protein